MRRERWTLILVSEKGDNLRRVTFYTRTFQLALGAAGFLCAALLLAVGLVGFYGSRSIRTTLLERENATLSEELGLIQTRVGELGGEIGLAAGRDAELRTLAGLERIDQEVLQVGVGGPGSPTLDQHPLYRLDPELGAKAFSVVYDLDALERRSRLLRESMREASDSITAHRDLLESTPSILPTEGLLTSGFSQARLHPIFHEALPHEGMDVSAPMGNPIRAAAKGRVTFVGVRDGYGLVVEIDHGYDYVTLYGHASRVLVSRGQGVSRGDVIAQVGNTGIATGPHLHYEVRVNGRPVNPERFVLPGVVP
ncbi:MAG: M23 family metallopeptidase [Gemmatimonadetes bacterium]|nr:M23 family metallopeptidase [Gemmatimonadota bacterium]